MFQEYQNNKLVMFNKTNFRDKKEYIFDDAGSIPVFEELKRELGNVNCELTKTKQELEAEREVSLTYKQELENVKKQFSNVVDCELNKTKQELDAERKVSLTYKQQLENVKKQFSNVVDCELNKTKRELDTVKCELDKNKQELDKNKQELDKTKQELDAEKKISLIYKQQLENVKKQLTQFSDIGDIGRIKSYNFSYSKCTYCKIKDVKLEVLSYRNIIEHIYSIIDDGYRIIKNTVLIVKTTGLNVKNEFTHLWKLGINTQGAPANKSLEEIIQQCTSNNISYDIKITLLTGEIVEFKKCF